MHEGVEEGVAGEAQEALRVRVRGNVGAEVQAGVQAVWDIVGEDLQEEFVWEGGDVCHDPEEKAP